MHVQNDELYYYTIII